MAQDDVAEEPLLGSKNTSITNKNCVHCGKKNSSIDVCDHTEAKADGIPEIGCEVNAYISFRNNTSA